MDNSFKRPLLFHANRNHITTVSHRDEPVLQLIRRVRALEDRFQLVIQAGPRRLQGTTEPFELLAVIFVDLSTPDRAREVPLEVAQVGEKNGPGRKSGKIVRLASEPSSERLGEGEEIPDGFNLYDFQGASGKGKLVQKRRQQRQVGKRNAMVPQILHCFPVQRVLGFKRLPVGYRHKPRYQFPATFTGDVATEKRLELIVFEEVGGKNPSSCL